MRALLCMCLTLCLFFETAVDVSMQAAEEKKKSVKVQDADGEREQMSERAKLGGRAKQLLTAFMYE